MPLRQMLRTSSVLRASLGYCLKYKTILRLFRDKNVFFMIFYKGHIKNYIFYEIFIKKIVQGFFLAEFSFNEFLAINHEFLIIFSGISMGDIVDFVEKFINSFRHIQDRNIFFLLSKYLQGLIWGASRIFLFKFSWISYQNLTVLKIFSKHFLHGNLGIFNMCSYFFTEYPLEDSYFLE